MDPLLEFETMLDDCKRTSIIHNPPRDFILVHRLLNWFVKGVGQETNAIRILNAVCGRRLATHLVRDLLLVIHPDNERCWLKVFTILLQMGKGEHIAFFCNKLSIRDSNLPKGRGDWCGNLWQIPGLLSPGVQTPDEFYEKFSKLQYELCTEDSLAQQGGILDQMMILPICRFAPIKTELPKSSTPDPPSRVNLIEVPHDCIPQNIRRRLKLEEDTEASLDGVKHQEFALKVLQNQDDYKQETFAYSALEEVQGIVQCLGFWEFRKPSEEQPEYHLLLEYGSFDLDDYFQTFPPPSLPLDILEFWKDLCEVAIALENIHNIKYTVASDTILHYGWHLDIKPENILLCEERWKIADPGFTRILRQTDVTIYENELPAIVPRGGTKGYGPPEGAVQPKLPVTQRFDIWSLGCVFSEAATWILLGNRGIEQFRMIRKSMERGNRKSISFTEPGGDDCFHNGETVSQAVIDWHGYLRQSLRTKGTFTGDILDLVEQHMLVASAKDRFSSKDIVRWFKKNLRTAESDKSIPSYHPPPYFAAAFEAEQRMAFKELSSSSIRTKSNRYKSTKFLNSIKSRPLGLNASGFEQSDTYTPLLKGHVSTANRVKDHGPRRAISVTTKMTQDSLTPTVRGTARAIFDTDRTSGLSGGKTAEIPRFNLWDALNLLESTGWVYKGTLERPSDTQSLPSPNPSVGPNPNDKENSFQNLANPQRPGPYPIDPVQQVGSIHHSRHGSRSSSKSLFGRMFKRSSKSIDILHPIIRPQSNAPPVLKKEAVEPKTLNEKEEVDKYRNNEFDEYFEKRDIVFLLDNGASMAEYWPMVRALVAVLVGLLHGQDDDGMDIYFTSSAERYGPFSEPQKFIDIINQMKPRDLSKNADSSKDKNRAEDIRKTLSDILNKVGNDTYERKLTLIILTDGIWKGIGNKRTVADEITQRLQRWEDEEVLKTMMDNRELSLQFIQFGNNEDASVEFDYMDNWLARPDGTLLPDVIDVEHATGNIKKMILGSLSAIWDGFGPPTVQSDDSQPPLNQGDLSHVSSASELYSSPTEVQNYRFSGAVVEEPADLPPGPSRQGAVNDFGPDIGYYGSQFQPSFNMAYRVSGNPPLQQLSTQGSPSRHHHRRGTKESITSNLGFRPPGSS